MRRWALHGRQTVALHTTVLSREADLWRAWWEVGPRVAALDGVTALQDAGLTGYRDDCIHVSVPHTAAVVAPPGVRVHKVARRVEGELSGMPRLRTVPAVAAVRAAHWAVSDRQAALTLVMPVQQRLVTGSQLLAAAKSVRGRTRRAFIPAVARDIADGAQSLGELDFAVMCRSRGLPEPTRQAVRTMGVMRAYLDVAWEDVGLVVEIDGSQHQWGTASTDDQFRQNSLVIGGERVLRMTLMGLRLAPDRFMDQVCAAYWSLSGGSPSRSR
jgi:very-short-patch-repair endonuclease